MKSSDILQGIAARTTATAPIEPRFTALPFEDDEDGVHALTANLRDEFHGLYRGLDELDPANIASFDGLFVWLADSLRNFPGGALSAQRRLVDMLALASMLDQDGKLWGELAQVVPAPPPAFLEGISRTFVESRVGGEEALRRARFNPTQIASVLADVMAQDWRSFEPTMIRHWHHFCVPQKSQAAAALYQYNRPRLAALLESLHDVFEVGAYVYPAPIPQTLQFALASSNWTFKFWAFHKSVYFAAHGYPSYPVEWQGLLTQAAEVPEEWARWMAVINEFPSRYPQLQAALGNSLVTAPDSALDEYASSISTISELERPVLAEALEAFGTMAPLAARQRLWTAIYKRWEAWDFGRDEHSKSLFRVAKSNFDYPVIGYMVECLSAEERAQMAAALEARAAAFERTWHPDVSTAMTDRFKLISAYQLLAHAEAVAAGTPNWLHDGALYKPAWEDGSLFRSLKYDLRMHEPTF